MKYLKFCYLLLSLVLISSFLQAQDKVYYKKSKIDNWKVTEITPGYIKGTDVKNPQISYSISHPNVLFLFNSIGNFLVIPKLYDSQAKSGMYINNYLHQNSNAFHTADRIITVRNTIITGTIESETEQELVCTVNNKRSAIPKADIVVIIFKNGNHKMLANVDKTFKVLRAIQDDYNNLAFSTIKVKNPNNNYMDTVGTLSAKQKNAIVKTSVAEPGKSAVVQNSAKQTVVTSKDSAFKMQRANTDSQSVKSAISHEGSKNNAVAELSPITLVSLQDKAVGNIRELESYIKLISDRQSDPDRITKAIGQALSLFASEESRIEVSSKNRMEAQQYKVRVYLNRLGLIKYDKVIVEWYNVQYVSKVRKNPDGTYTGFIEFEQRFTGISGDKKLYQDITRKTIEIVLKTYYKKSGGETTIEWDVFLGNIGINVTKA